MREIFLSKGLWIMFAVLFGITYGFFGLLILTIHIDSLIIKAIIGVVLAQGLVWGPWYYFARLNAKTKWPTTPEEIKAQNDYYHDIQMKSGNRR